MVLDVYCLQKGPFKKGGVTYYHTSFAVHCADGWYDMGFFGNGKGADYHAPKADGTRKMVDVVKNETKPDCAGSIKLGQTAKGLQDIIEHGRNYETKLNDNDEGYILYFRDCGTFVEGVAQFCGVGRAIQGKYINTKLY